jgi:pyruvate formate lyase activating enzyme
MAEQCEWIAGELGRHIPLHLSKYYPMYKRDDPATSEDTLHRLYEIASERLDYVYLGNTRTGNGQDTHCPECNEIVTRRSGYSSTLMNLDQEGRCAKCGTSIYRNFTFSLPKER